MIITGLSLTETLQLRPWDAVGQEAALPRWVGCWDVVCKTHRGGAVRVQVQQKGAVELLSQIHSFVCSFSFLSVHPPHTHTQRQLLKRTALSRAHLPCLTERLADYQRTWTMKRKETSIPSARLQPLWGDLDTRGGHVSTANVSLCLSGNTKNSPVALKNNKTNNNKTHFKTPQVAARVNRKGHPILPPRRQDYS